MKVLTREQRRSIGWDYAYRLFIAVFIIVGGCWASNWGTPSPSIYFVAIAWLIHAHGNRIRDTMIALAGNKETK